MLVNIIKFPIADHGVLHVKKSLCEHQFSLNSNEDVDIRTDWLFRQPLLPVFKTHTAWSQLFKGDKRSLFSCKSRTRKQKKKKKKTSYLNFEIRGSLK